jgi:ClpP class serine protease
MEGRLRSELSPALIAQVREAVHGEQAALAETALYEAKGGAAHISISGSLAEKRQVSDDLYGEVTTYEAIRRATAAAGADPLVRKIVYHVNSSGGSWDGLDYTAEAIKTAAKPTEAIVYTAAQSAAYFLASQAGKVYAATAGSLAGSIGVAAEVFDRTAAEGQKGVKRYVLTNRDSPDKRPKEEEEEGRALITDRLDDLYQIFERRVVEGRSKNVKGFSAGTIRALAGRSVTAERALELGLIDGILPEMAGGDGNGIDGGLHTMKLAEFIAANSGAREEAALYAASEFGMITPAKAAEQAAAAEAGAAARAGNELAQALAADRERVLELLELSGAALAPGLKEAVTSGASSGEYAKARVRELSAALAAPNAASLGQPRPRLDMAAQLAPRETAPPDALTDEAAIRRMAKSNS